MMDLRVVGWACLTLLLLNCNLTCVNGEFFLASFAVGSALAGAAYMGYCMVFECCGKPWVEDSVEGLQARLDERLFGQHIVQRLVVQAVGQHLKKPNPKKALVLSFHGDAGVGKSFVSRLIVDSLLKKGENSSYVRNFIGFRHFYWISEADKPRMKKMMQNWIMGNATRCPRTIFIFDEMEVISEGFMDVLSPFLDYHARVDGTDFRKTIFIFVSNIGAREIRDITLKNFNSGQSREELQLSDFRRNLEAAAFNEEGGLKMSSLIEKRLVDFFFPFLPLEKRHVRQCVEHEFRSNNYMFDEDDVKQVLSQIDFYPEGVEAFSVDGCRSVYRLVADQIAHRGAG